MKTKSMMVLGLCMAIAASVLPNTVRGESKPIKTLIVDGQNNHNWKETTPILVELMEASGRFDVDVSTCPPSGADMSGYKPQFDKYALVVVNNGNNADRWPKETEKAFEDFVSSGGGVVIYHAADNAYGDWPAFNEMMAIGGWGGRSQISGPYLFMDKDGKVLRDPAKGKAGGHGKQVPFEITVRDMDHPITRGLPRTFIHGPDELYAFLRGPAKNVTILATAHSPKDNRGSGREEPMLMTIRYGKGKVFHTVLGHAGAHIRKDSFVTTFLRGSEWAATGQVTIPVPEGFPQDDSQSGKR